MRLIIAGLLAMMLTGPLRAQPAISPADTTAIQQVIRGQLDAFAHDNAAAAFGFASPGIQAAMGSPEQFMALVRHGYAPVYRPRSVDFTTLTADDPNPIQSVELIGPDGLAYTARYEMERQPDGTWRIAGCSLLESRRVGT